MNFLDTLNRWRGVLSIDTPEKLEAFSEIIERLELAETDAEYYRAIVKGTWPNAVQILERSLEKAKAHISQG